MLIFYQPARSARPAGSPKITSHFPRLHLSSALITCAIITSCTLLPWMRRCFSRLWQFIRLLFVATMSSLAQLRTSSRWIPRSRGNVDVTTWGLPRAETPEVSSYSWYLHSRYPTENGYLRALEWIGASKARLVFRYEISDLPSFAMKCECKQAECIPEMTR